MSTCYLCNQRILKAKIGIKCFVCGIDCHANCATPAISSEVHEKIQSGSIKWRCNSCINSDSSTSTVSDSGDKNSSDISKLKSAMSKFASDLLSLKQKQTEFTDSLESLNGNFSELLKSSEILSQHESRIEFLESKNIEYLNELSIIKRKLESVDESARNKNILIHGITYSDAENLTVIINLILSFLDVPSLENNIVRISRMRIRMTESVQPILIVFNDVHCKQKLIDALKVKKTVLKRNLTLLDVGISAPDVNKSFFFTDHLTASNQEILKKAKLLKGHDYKFVWSQNGKVLCRKDDNCKIIKLTSIDVVDKLLKD